MNWKKWFLLIDVVLVLVVIGAALCWGAGSEGGDPAARHREFLRWEAGTWDATIHMAAQPGGAARKLEAVQTDRMSCCDQWLITDLGIAPEVPGGKAPSPYEGHGVLGYDPVKKKLVGVWVDSQQDWLGVAEGTVNDAGDQLTLSVEGRDPATGHPLKMRFLTTKMGKDRRRLEISISMGGQQIPVARIESKRRTQP